MWGGAREESDFDGEDEERDGFDERPENEEHDGHAQVFHGAHATCAGECACDEKVEADDREIPFGVVDEVFGGVVETRDEFAGSCGGCDGTDEHVFRLAFRAFGRVGGGAGSAVGVGDGAGGAGLVGSEGVEEGAGGDAGGGVELEVFIGRTGRAGGGCARAGGAGGTAGVGLGGDEGGRSEGCGGGGRGGVADDGEGECASGVAREAACGCAVADASDFKGEGGACGDVVGGGGTGGEEARSGGGEEIGDGDCLMFGGIDGRAGCTGEW